MKYRLKGNRKIQQHNNNSRSTKSWFFEKNKADRVSARLKLTKKNEDSSSEKKEMFPDTVDRQRLIKSTMNNYSPTSWIIQKKRDTFPETYNLPRLDPEETEIRTDQ